MRLEDISRMLAPLRTRIVNMLARSVVQRVDDSTKMQLVQLALSDDETREGVEHPQPYGFTSVPLEGAEAFVAFVGGRRDHGLALVVDDRRYRLKGLQGGEVAIYTDQGDSITIKRGGTVVVNARAVELAGNSNKVAKGEPLNTAIANLGSAIAGAFTTMGGTGGTTPLTAAQALAAASTVNGAVTTFNTAAANALSTKVKLS